MYLVSVISIICRKKGKIYEKRKKGNHINLIISLFLLLTVTVSDININPLLPLNNIKASAAKKNVYSYYSEDPYTMYLDYDAYGYSLNLKTGKLTKKRNYCSELK